MLSLLVILLILYLLPFLLAGTELTAFGSIHIVDTMRRIAPNEFWETFYSPVIFLYKLGLER